MFSFPICTEISHLLLLPVLGPAPNTQASTGVGTAADTVRRSHDSGVLEQGKAFRTTKMSQQVSPLIPVIHRVFSPCIGAGRSGQQSCILLLTSVQPPHHLIQALEAFCSPFLQPRFPQLSAFLCLLLLLDLPVQA